MSLTRFALRFAAPAPQVEQYERYLFIGPHPDDVEIGAGATAAKLAAAGKQITFLICTDGRYGLENAPAGTAPEEPQLRPWASTMCASSASVTAVSMISKTW